MKFSSLSGYAKSSLVLCLSLSALNAMAFSKSRSGLTGGDGIVSPDPVSAVDVLHKNLVFQAAPSALTRISIKAPGSLKAEQVQVLEDSSLTAPKADVSVVGLKEDSIIEFNENFGFSANEMTIELKTQGSSFCAIKKVNDQIVGLNGVCVEKVVLYIPNSSYRVLLDDNQLIFGTMGYDDLVLGLKSTIRGSEDVALLDSYLTENQGRVLTISQSIEIMKAMTFNEVTAAALMSGRISDPHNAPLAASAVTFQSDKDSVVNLLSR